MRQVAIGEVAGVFGVKGELKVRSLIDAEELFEELEEVLLETPGGRNLNCAVASARPHKGHWLVKLEGIDSPEDGLKYKGSRLYIDKADLPEVEEDEIYWVDIEGSRVVDRDGKDVGLLVDVLETGAHDVFQIDGADGAEYMISNNREHVLKIDPENKLVVIDRIGLVKEN